MKYRVKEGQNILHNNNHFFGGDLIELSEQEAKRLEEFIEPVEKKFNPENLTLKIEV